MLYALLSANDFHRDTDRDFEDQLKYLHEYYQKQQRNKITIRDKE